MTASHHKFVLKTGLTPYDATVELDGKPLTGVRRISVDVAAQDMTVVRLEIYGEIEVESGEIEVESEFREDAILKVEQPLDGR